LVPERENPERIGGGIGVEWDGFVGGKRRAATGGEPKARAGVVGKGRAALQDDSRRVPMNCGTFFMT
jgi:hypothetical protein